MSTKSRKDEIGAVGPSWARVARMKGDTMDVTEIVARALLADKHPDLPWEVASDVCRMSFEGHARAAIEALATSGFVIVPRIPTDAMLNAGWETDDNGWDGPEACWTAMIDAALKEKP